AASMGPGGAHANPGRHRPRSQEGRSAVSADERIGSGARQQLAAELALHGGRLALEYFHRARRDDTHDDTADADIRQRLAARIAATFPDDAVVGAEPGQ